jgi:4-hydroxyphenylpyruvate dioxygenase-like putative hemolysin
MPDGIHQLKLNKVDQIGIVVKDADAVIKSWSALFNLGPWTYREMNGKNEQGQPVKVKLAFTMLGSVQIELIQPVEGRIFHSEFLDVHGEGLHHLGFYVDDVDAEAANLVKQGASVLSTLPGRYAYMGTNAPGGVIFEVIRKPTT